MDETQAQTSTRAKGSWSYAIVRKTLTYLLLSIGVLFAIYPLFWMISTSLMSLGESMGTRAAAIRDPPGKLCECLE